MIPKSIVGESITMIHNEQKVIFDMLLIVLAVILITLDCTYSSVSAVPIQSVIDHHKEFVKKQDNRNEGYSGSSRYEDTSNSGSSGNSGKNDRSSSSTKSYFDNSIDEGDRDNKKINYHSKNDIRGTSTDYDLPIVEQLQPPIVSQKHETRESAPPIGTLTSQPPAPPTACEQASNCTHQQDSNNRDHMTITNDSTPFSLPMPFP